MKIFRYLLVALISFAAGWTVFAYLSHVERPWVYKLEAPLMLAGGDADNPPTAILSSGSLSQAQIRELLQKYVQ